jgi:catechol 2,3-dioxygenase-like lactoylglutathione lyase family enzyme
MRALGIDHVVILCSDIDLTLAWWQRELGLDPVRVEEWRAGDAPFPSLRLNASTIIDFLPGKRTGENVAHVAIDVDVDADTLESLVAERGWDVVFPLNRELFGARGMGAGIYVRDPEGNVIELRSYVA